MFMEPQQPIQPIYTSTSMQPAGNGWTQKQKRIMLIAGVLVGLIVLLFLATAIFGGKQSVDQVALTTVSARNIGILNLLDTFESDLRTAEGGEYVSRAKILIASDNLLIMNYLASRYSTAPSKQQTLNLNFGGISSELEKATTQSDFDKFFISTIDYEIEANKTLLKNLDPADIDSVLEPIVSTSITNYDSLLN